MSFSCLEALIVMQESSQKPISQVVVFGDLKIFFGHLPLSPSKFRLKGSQGLGGTPPKGLGRPD